MDAGSIVIGNEWERFHECWHERFILYTVNMAMSNLAFDNVYNGVILYPCITILAYPSLSAVLSSDLMLL